MPIVHVTKQYIYLMVHSYISSVSFDMTVKITGHVCFSTHVSILLVNACYTFQGMELQRFQTAEVTFNTT